MVQNPLVDLTDLVINYIENSALKKRKFPNAEKIKSSDISWLHVRIRHDDAKYVSTGESSKPSASILFSSTFENNTKDPQVYTLKTERTTNSLCTYNLNRAYSYGKEISIKLNPPYLEAGAGFQKEMRVEKMNEHTFMQQLTWSVDNQVSVPSGYKTKADLVILEKEYEGHFTRAIHYSGSINVMIQGKDNSGTMTADVTDIFDRDAGFQVENGVSTFICEGACKCRYGVEQSVKLTQSQITQDLENGIEHSETTNS